MEFDPTDICVTIYGSTVLGNLLRNLLPLKHTHIKTHTQISTHTHIYTRGGEIKQFNKKGSFNSIKSWENISTVYVQSIFINKRHPNMSNFMI